MSKYFDRVRDLRNDPFFPCSLLKALYLANTGFVRRCYDDQNYHIEVSLKGRVLGRHQLPFNMANASRIGRLLDALKDHETKGDRK
jgi:hypothetical protein